MTIIKKYVEKINDEICGAKDYAEKALEAKAMGDSEKYARYKGMASDELNHAMIIHDYAVKDIEKLKAVYPTIPESMAEKWEKSHADYVERTAWIRMMLQM